MRTPANKHLLPSIGFDTAMNEPFKNKFPPKIYCALENKINRDLILDTIDLIEFMDREQIHFIESNLLESTYVLPSQEFSAYSKGFILVEESILIGIKPEISTKPNQSKNSQVLHLLDFSELIVILIIPVPGSGRPESRPAF